MRWRMLGVFVLSACRSDNVLIWDTEPIEITLTSPAYGEFLGEGPVEVRGRVSNPYANVLLQGQEIEIEDDGSFSATLPLLTPWLNVDAQAWLAEERARVRVPVFRGHDPAETWPGGITARFTPAALDKLGTQLGAVVDATGWDEQLGAALPSYSSDLFELVSLGISHDPTTVALRPVQGGIDTGIDLNKVSIDYNLVVHLGTTTFEVPVSVGYGLISVTALGVPDVDEAGMLSLSLTQPNVSLDAPTIEVYGVDLWLLDLIVEAVSSLVEPVGELALGLVLDQVGTMDLGGPFAFETDLLGEPIEMRLSDVYGEPAGLGADLRVGLGEPAGEGPLGLSAPSDFAADAHLALGLHEGLIDGVMSDELVGMLSQDLQLAGVFGTLIGTGIKALPGGSAAPDEGGWCLEVEPGTAHVARLQTGLDPFAEIYLPDVRVRARTMTGSACVPWLEASLAMVLRLRVTDGTKVGIELVVPEGAVLDYQTDGQWTEALVIDGLGTVVEGLVGLLGGQLEFDLADMLGGLGGGEGDTASLFGEMQPEFLDSEPLVFEDGTQIEGLYTVSLRLWK